MEFSPSNASADIGVCKDSVLSTTSSVLSIITFFYAVALGSYFVIKATRESNDKFDQIIRATEYTKLELAVSRQNFEKSDDEFYGGRFGRESDQRIRKDQKDQMQHLMNKASLQFEKSDTQLQAFKVMFPGYDERRSKDWGFLHDLDEAFELIGIYFDAQSWRFKRMMGFGDLVRFALLVPLMIAFYVTRAFTWTLARSIGWRLQVWKWPHHIKWILKQEELLIMMRETEDVMNQIRSAELRRILQESTVVSNHVIHDIYSGFDGIGHQVHETRQAIDSLLKEKVDEGQNTNVARSEEYIARNVCGEASDELERDISEGL